MQKFSLGDIHVTPGVLNSKIPLSKLSHFMYRHGEGDWGLVPEEDKRSNDESISRKGMILSAYAIDESQPCKGYGHNTLWVITDAGHETTTLLLPDEY